MKSTYKEFFFTERDFILIQFLLEKTGGISDSVLVWW